MIIIIIFYFYVLHLYCPNDISPMGNSGCFPWGKPAATTVHAGYFSVSIIHQTLTWTTGSLMCAQILMHANAHRGVWTHLRKSALKVDSHRKIPCALGNQTCVSGMMV